MTELRIYLASASPRRLELMRQIGLRPLAVPVGLDERALAGETPETMVRRLAQTKALLAAELPATRDPGLILAADTAVVIDGDALGKPRDASHAREMLRRLCGRGHQVLTGVYLKRTDDGRSASHVARTHVSFRSYDEATISAYVDGGEPMDKAGAYGIQGRGALLTERIEGSWSNVVGLPVERLPEWMREIGVDLERLIRWGRSRRDLM